MITQAKKFEDLDHDLINQISRDYFSIPDTPVIFRPEEYLGPCLQKTTDPFTKNTIIKSVYVIGSYLVGDFDLSNAIHEMGHFAERSVEILKTFPNQGWGFKLGKYWQIGTSWGYEPQTDASVWCEIRAFAYQASLMKHYKMEVNYLDFAELVSLVPAYFWCFRHDIEDKEKKKQFVADEIKKHSDTSHTLEHFNQAWFERISQLIQYKVEAGIT